MGERSIVADYEALDRLLAALGESVADEMVSAVPVRTGTRTLRGAVRAALSEPAAPIADTTRPRGVPAEVVVRGALHRFLPGATAVSLPLFALSFLLDPFNRALALPLLLVLLFGTVGFGAALMGLRRWLFPHSNPDGNRSDVAGMAVPMVALGVGVGLAGAFGPLTRLAAALVTSVVAFGVGGTAAVLAYGPWLRSTERVGRPAPLHRWGKLRATVVTGVGGWGVFTTATVVQGAVQMAAGTFPPQGMTLSEVLPSVLWQGGATGFVIGLFFAVLLGALYARVPVERLQAWRVGLLGALGGLVPYWSWLTLRGLGSPGPLFDDPLATIARVSLSWAIPGFILAYGAVRLAQRSTSGDR